MANATFGVNIIPKNNTVTIGNSDSPWKIVSPSLEGTPTAPTASTGTPFPYLKSITASTGTNTTQVATTAFVKNSIDAKTGHFTWGDLKSGS